MLFNNSAPDRTGTLDLTAISPSRMDTPVYTSHAGDILMGLICVLALALSPLVPVAVAIALPVLTVKKKQNAERSFRKCVRMQISAIGTRTEHYIPVDVQLSGHIFCIQADFDNFAVQFKSLKINREFYEKISNLDNNVAAFRCSHLHFVQY